MMRLFVFIVFVFLYAPIAFVIASSFMEDGSFTLKWFENVFEDKKIATAFKNSLSLAILSTLISVILGTTTAYAYLKTNMRFESIFYTPIVIPEITEALSLLLFYNFTSFPLGFYSVLLGHIAFNVAFVFVIVKARLAGYERSIEEASLTLGANEIQTFLRVTLPLAMPGVIAASLIAFILSWDNFIKTIFTTGPGFQTLPMLIWSQAVRGSINPTLNALTSLLLLISMILAYLYVRISAKRK